MSRICDICEKSSQKGNKIKLQWGVKYRSIKHRQPNLRKTTLMVDGESKQLSVCTTCLKSAKKGKIANVKPVEYKFAEASAS